MVNFIIKTDDYSLVQEKVDSISKSMDNPDIITYDLDNDSIYNVVDELTTISLFDNPKLVILKSGDKLLSESKERLDEIVGAMADVNNTNVLVIYDTKFDTKSEERFSKYSLLKKYSQEFDLSVKSVNLEEYARGSFIEDRYTINDDALNILCNSSTTFSMLKSNIDVLKCYTMETKLIDRSTVDLLISKPIDDDLYLISNAVLKHDKRLVMNLYSGFKIKNLKTGTLISLLINKFQELYNVHIFARGNVKQADIATIFNVSSGKAYYLLKDSKNQSLEEIKANLEYLSKLEYDIRKGKIDDELGLELYFLR